MTGQPKSGQTPKGGEKNTRDRRAERLAAALRANLRRRKQQARVRGAAKEAQESGN